jgi:hypothetical protein
MRRKHGLEQGPETEKVRARVAAALGSMDMLEEQPGL